MAIENEVTLTILKLITVALGGTFLWFAGAAWLRHRDHRMAVLFVAIALMTTAALAEGVAYRGIGLTLDQSHVVEAVVMLVAFAVLVGSLFLGRRGGKRLRDSDASSADDLNAQDRDVP